MWKIHTPILLVAVALFLLGLSGGSLIGTSMVDRLLAETDIALQGMLSYPTLAAFGAGLLVAYAVYGLWLLDRYHALIRWLVRLTDLWAEGVAIRTDGYALATDPQVTAWVERRYTGWHNRVVDVLEPLAPVEARVFASTPETPSADDGATFRSPFHRINLLAMAQEVDKLKQIIDRHQARLSPVVVALIMRLQELQGAGFGRVTRARRGVEPEPPDEPTG